MTVLVRPPRITNAWREMTLPLLSRLSRPSQRPFARGQLTLTDTLRFLLAFSDFEATDTLPVLVVEDGVRLESPWLPWAPCGPRAPVAPVAPVAPAPPCGPGMPWPPGVPGSPWGPGGGGGVDEVVVRLSIRKPLSAFAGRGVPLTR